jgi:uncharacterized damage-inducible protein DinB
VRINEIVTMYDYNYWANHRVLQATTRITPKQFTARANLRHRSVRGALVHLLNTEWMWRIRCEEGTSPSPLLNEKDFPTVESLQEHWQEEEQAMRSYLAGLKDEDLMQTLHYTTAHGRPLKDVLWHLLSHVVYHGTQIRGEVANLLTHEWGVPPGGLDFIYFLRQQDTW